MQLQHRPHTTRLHPALSCTAAFIFLQLYVEISFFMSLFCECSLVMSTVMLAWRRCHHFSVCESKSIFFFFQHWLFFLTNVTCTKFSSACSAINSNYCLSSVWWQLPPRNINNTNNTPNNSDSNKTTCFQPFS